MRGRFLAAVAFALCAVLMNGAQAENIAPGLKVIVLDAGHGGKFPGAHYGKVYEKDLTLAVVLRLGRLIEQGMPGVKVVYTRKTDKELGATLLDDLQARADIANGAGGELFVSVHVNAAAATSARGVETLIMGETPKEQRYNENALYESNREDLIDMSDERTAAIVRAYIQNLQFTYGEYSMAMARCIQSSYGKAGRHLRGIKPQLLRVLYATDMPGVLTEIGFMSNPQEMAYMKSEKGQAEIARSLYNAVRDYDAYLRGTQLPELADVEAEEKPAPETVQAAGERKSGSEATQRADTEVRYAVQVLASPRQVALSSSQFGKYRNKVKQYDAEGSFRYKYCVGEYRTQEEARKALREVRRSFPDAFVVRCSGGRIVK